jgi:FemAB-related protein (PEP-CTERM system-associated)
MIRPMTDPAHPPIAVTAYRGRAIDARLPALTAFALHKTPNPLARHPGWLTVFRDGFGHDVYALEATAAGQTCGFLPLAFVRSLLFGRFLVSLPYLNSNGVIADSADVQSLLIDRAVELANRLKVRYLELRHEAPLDHTALTGRMTTKVHMRMSLPDTAEKLWKGFDTKVRNQVRKGEKSNLTASWGGLELFDPFYAVLCHNMRDLGTPVYGKRLFRSLLATFPDRAELCVVRSGETPVAAALLLHGDGVTEVPTASHLREFNATNCNMFMYRHLLDRAVERKQAVFDFGRSTAEGPTFKFKKQWGGEPHPATWQYYVRRGSVGEMRPDNPRYQRMIKVWQRLPVRLTQYLGPAIVRGIP